MIACNDRPFGVWGAYVITSGDAVELAKGACRGGARIIQYREKDASRKELLATAREIRRITNAYQALFIVNDYLDIALLADADGVHLGQDDIFIADARRIAPQNFIVGISTHSMNQAKTAEADGADYIGIGPAFATPIKPDYRPINLDTLHLAVSTLQIPVVAIGGINLENIAHLKEAGVVNAAMVREFVDDTEETVRRVNHLLLG